MELINKTRIKEQIMNASVMKMELKEFLETF